MEETENIYGFYKETTPGISLLKNAYDLHLHTGPAVFERLLTHLEAAKAAKQVGMKALVFKDHHSETASKGTIVKDLVTDIETYGSIVLNHAVGGLNPSAVDAAINYGAKIVFMPTIDSLNHINHFGKEGATYAHLHTVASGRKLSYRDKGITILTDKGEIVSEIEEILNLLAEADIALATSHISSEESTVLVDEARNSGVDKIIINHANYWILELDIEKQVELAKKGAFIELVYATMLPFDEKGGTTSTMTQAVYTIKKVGAERCILSSDLGQPHNVAPVEGLRAFYATLIKKGIRKEDIETMNNRNPKKILDT